MKCRNCGFVYDDEAVCPICATPAERPAPEEQENPYQTFGAPAEQPAAQAEQPKPAEPPKPPKHPRWFMISMRCVVSAIAGCMLFNTVTGIIEKASDAETKKERDKAIENINKLTDKMLDMYKSYEALGFLKNIDDSSSDLLDGIDSEDFDSSASPTKSLSDGLTHKVGEAYQFENGTISLKSLRVSNASSSFDADKQQVALTVELTNNTKEQQAYDEVDMFFEDSEFDIENFLFTESSINSDENGYVLKPGETLTMIYYYNMPKANQSLNCKVVVFGDAGKYETETAYSFEIKDIK